MSDIQLPATEDGIRARIAALGIGECYAIAERFDLSSVGVNVVSVAEKLRARLKAPTIRVKRMTERDFTTETGEFATRSGHLLVCAAVTRIE